MRQLSQQAYSNPACIMRSVTFFAVEFGRVDLGCMQVGQRHQVAIGLGADTHRIFK